MIDDPLVRAFEAGTVDPAKFNHREHLYVAWCYLKALTLEDALLRYVRHLRLLASTLGVPGKYHATITWGYLVLLDEAMHDPELSCAGFDAVLEKHPTLLDRHALHAYYKPEELASPAARQRFVLPRRTPASP
jgi:hypothetical protein